MTEKLAELFEEDGSPTPTGRALRAAGGRR